MHILTPSLVSPVPIVARTRFQRPGNYQSSCRKIMREFPSLSFFFSFLLIWQPRFGSLLCGQHVLTPRSIFVLISYPFPILPSSFSSVSQIQPIAKRSGNLNFQHFAELRSKRQIPRTKSDVLCN